MMGERFMVVGAVGSGKTTLLRALNGVEGNAEKTQSIQYQGGSIDTPGEFIENPFFYKALFATSLEAGTIVFIQDATRIRSVFPPGFAAAFSKRTVGVVTKIDHEEADEQRARGFLQSLGLNGPVLAVSALHGDGMDQLKTLLNC